MKTSTLLPYEVGDIARNKADQLLFDPEQLIQNPSDSARPVCKTSTAKYEIPLPWLGSSLIHSGRTGNLQKPSKLLLPSTAAPGRVCRPSMYHLGTTQQCFTTNSHARPWALVNVAGRRRRSGRNTTQRGAATAPLLHNTPQEPQDVPQDIPQDVFDDTERERIDAKGGVRKDILDDTKRERISSNGLPTNTARNKK